MLLPGGPGSGGSVRGTGQSAYRSHRGQSRTAPRSRSNVRAHLRVEPVHHVSGRGLSFVPPGLRSSGTIVFFRRHLGATLEVEASSCSLGFARNAGGKFLRRIMTALTARASPRRFPLQLALLLAALPSLVALP